MAQGKRTAVVNRKRGHGKAAPNENIPQAAKATRIQIAQVRDRLTCDDARFWFDFQLKQAQSNLLVTETSLTEFKRWAEAEAQVDFYERELTKARESGKPISTQIVVVEMVDGEERKHQALGIESLFARASDRAARHREKMGFNPLDVTKIRVSRQRDMFEEQNEAAKHPGINVVFGNFGTSA